jgi:cellulose synthase/poly-beta-1,6-N-acetylglucosamine synthase-like glycosyltransferase
MLLTILAAIPVAILLAEVLASLVTSARNLPSYSARTAEQNVAVVVPAHNESSGIAATLATISPQLRAGDRLVVVADNCADDTASVASRSGAEVIERRDLTKHGKGYALDFALKHLDNNPPKIVIFIDADCQVSEGAIAQTASVCAASGRPVQILDLMAALDGSTINYRVAEFAWRVRNWVRPLGLAALGLPCPLMGTGMAFPWGVIRSADLATGALTEDRKLGLALAHAGHAPLFCVLARVTSHFPASSEGAATQRRRWEEGTIRTIFGEAPRAIGMAVVTGNIQLLALALDALVPPLSLLAMLTGGMFLVTGAAALFGAAAVPFTISSISLGALIAAVALAWLKYGRDVLPAAAIFSVAAYALGKLPLYRQIFSSRAPSRWVRTDRGKS